MASPFTDLPIFRFSCNRETHQWPIPHPLAVLWWQYHNPRKSQPDKCVTNSQSGKGWASWSWPILESQRNYCSCNQGLFLQCFPWKMTTNKEQIPLLANRLFQIRPLVVMLQRKMMLHQEMIRLKYPQIQTFSLKIAVSVKFQNLLVIQVCNNVICFSWYCRLVHLKGWTNVWLIRGSFSFRIWYCFHCSSASLLFALCQPDYAHSDDEVQVWQYFRFPQWRFIISHWHFLCFSYCYQVLLSRL